MFRGPLHNAANHASWGQFSQILMDIIGYNAEETLKIFSETMRSTANIVNF